MMGGGGRKLKKITGRAELREEAETGIYACLLMMTKQCCSSNSINWHEKMGSYKWSVGILAKGWLFLSAGTWSCTLMPADGGSQTQNKYTTNWRRRNSFLALPLIWMAKMTRQRNGWFGWPLDVARKNVITMMNGFSPYIRPWVFHFNAFSRLRLQFLQKRCDSNG